MLTRVRELFTLFNARGKGWLPPALLARAPLGSTMTGAELSGAGPLACALL